MKSVKLLLALSIFKIKDFSSVWEESAESTNLENLLIYNHFTLACT